VGNGLESAEGIARLIRAAVADTHRYSAIAPIRFPDPGGAFPGDVLLRPPPVVVDANILRNDILYACRTGQRTVLVTAANAGHLRLFCAEHVYQEVIEHSGEWTAGGQVTRADFLRRWLLEYLPLIRVVPIGEGHLAWLSPAELGRVRHLAQPCQDPDDVPSAVLALLLGAFFLSQDAKPLRTVYGDTDLSGHSEWVNILKAGGDAGQLGKTFTLAVNLTALAGQGVASSARRIAAATSPWLLVAAGIGAAWWYMSRPASTRQQVTSAATSILTCALGAAIAYQQVQDQFASAAPKTPGWASLAADLPPAATLGRACMYTLARSTRCNQSAAELATDLPYLGVAQGEAKVRQILRDAGPFCEVWRGRWQAGHTAPELLRFLGTQPPRRVVPDIGQNRMVPGSEKPGNR
jgi:predicted nucleic acid-binding protein